MGSRASHLINRQQQQQQTEAAAAALANGDQCCDINNKHLNNNINASVKQILDSNGNININNNNNDNNNSNSIEEDPADELHSIKDVLRKQQASNGELAPQSISDANFVTTGNSATLDRNDQILANKESSGKGASSSSKFSTLQRQASHIQQALAQRIRRSSSFRAPTSKLRGLLPSFINGKRKVS